MMLDVLVMSAGSLLCTTLLVVLAGMRPLRRPTVCLDGLRPAAAVTALGTRAAAANPPANDPAPRRAA